MYSQVVLFLVNHERNGHFEENAVVKMKSLILLSPQHFLQMYHSVVLKPLPSPKYIYPVSF